MSFHSSRRKISRYVLLLFVIFSGVAISYNRLPEVLIPSLGFALLVPSCLCIPGFLSKVEVAEGAIRYVYWPFRSQWARILDVKEIGFRQRSLRGGDVFVIRYSLADSMHGGRLLIPARLFDTETIMSIIAEIRRLNPNIKVSVSEQTIKALAA